MEMFSDNSVIKVQFTDTARYKEPNDSIDTYLDQICILDTICRLGDHRRTTCYKNRYIDMKLYLLIVPSMSFAPLYAFRIFTSS